MEAMTAWPISAQRKLENLSVVTPATSMDGCQEFGFPSREVREESTFLRCVDGRPVGVMKVKRMKGASLLRTSHYWTHDLGACLAHS